MTGRFQIPDIEYLSQTSKWRIATFGNTPRRNSGKWNWK